MEYKILQDDFPDELVKQVNEHIAKGFKPLGGVSYAATDTGKGIYKAYVQAMVRTSEDVAG